MPDTDIRRLWRQGATAYGALAVAVAAGLLHYIPGPPRGPAATGDAHAAAGNIRTVAPFRRIILPDLAVIDPKGINAPRLHRIGNVHGVRQVLALDGASLASQGRRVNVIGVDAQLYRSWTPLSTASNQMQFLSYTWRVWGISAYGQPGPPNIMDPYDAVPSAALYLCAAGGATAAGLPKAIYAYNHASWYVAEVLALAQAYARAYG
jgi:hypothetical protein